MNAPHPVTANFLQSLLRPNRMTSIVDVGANPIDGDPPYKMMLAQRLCRITGFEPQPHALEALAARKGDLETYLPYVVGDGSEGTLNVTLYPGMTSLFEPNLPVMNCFYGFPTWATVTKTLPVTTRKLDDIAELEPFDMLKIDVQGAELSVFRGGREKLKHAVAVQSEVSFVALYKNQPTIGDIDLEMRAQGFIPHAMPAINKRRVMPAFDPSNPNGGVNQLVEADIVYVRDFTDENSMDEEQLKHLALIAFHCYGSFDLSMHCLQKLIVRKAVDADAIDRFIGALKATATP
jgi:FkbM family methyltransferase